MWKKRTLCWRTRKLANTKEERKKIQGQHEMKMTKYKAGTISLFFAMSVVLVVFIYTLILWSAQHWCSSWIWIISTYYWIRSSWWKILQLILCINLLCFFSFRFVLFCFNTLMTYGPNVIRTFFFLGKIRIFENK